MEWIRAAKVSDLTEGKGVAFEHADQRVALFLSGGRFYAIQNTCPHKGAPLADGHLENLELTCAWHAWSFDLKTGDCPTVPGVRLKTYEVKKEKGGIYVKI